ncbi:hypothetical protein BB558_005484 [Smittium angustum]|uniref:Tr-type G domain-containing protein n=1 Tax=Smittium angustum TaxID=133377 RepID=A0A2U1J0D6_SMIAN|nr:hypothetical protein BB558_005484 [Smittium angustum]
MATKELIFAENENIDAKNRGTIKNTNLIKLPPELDIKGNVEYKYKLTDVSYRKHKHLSTQLLWRLHEGNGEAIYQLGVHDDGTMFGITEPEMNTTIDVMKRMATELGDVEISSITWRNVSSSPTKDSSLLCNKNESSSDRFVAELVFKQKRDNLIVNDIRISLLGDHKAGKSTILGCIAHNIKDNGKGIARLGLLRHRHELETGTTSSINQEVIEVNHKGNIITSNINAHESENPILARKISHSTYKPVSQNGHHDVLNTNKQSKRIAFVDTCGHEKHLKTTIHGVFGRDSDYLMLVVPSDYENISKSINIYLMMSVLLRAPLMVVFTKVDLATSAIKSQLKGLVELIKKTIPKCGQTLINTNNSTLTEAKLSQLVNDFMKKLVIPIFLCSSLQPNMNILTNFISKLKPFTPSYNCMVIPKSLNYQHLIYGENCDSDHIFNEPNYDQKDFSLGDDSRRVCEFRIEKFFSVPHTGTIVVGQVVDGILTIQTELEQNNDLLKSPQDELDIQKRGVFYTTKSKNVNQNSETKGTINFKSGNTDDNIIQTKNSLESENGNFQNMDLNKSNYKYNYFLGPNKHGYFIKVDLKSIHHHEKPTTAAYTGQIVSVAIGLSMNELLKSSFFIKSSIVLYQTRKLSNKPHAQNGISRYSKTADAETINSDGKNCYVHYRHPIFSRIINGISNSDDIRNNHLVRKVSGETMISVDILANVVAVDFSLENVFRSNSGTLYCGLIRQQAVIKWIYYNGKKIRFAENKKSKAIIQKPDQTRNKRKRDEKTPELDRSYDDVIWDNLNKLATIYKSETNPENDPELSQTLNKFLHTSNVTKTNMDESINANSIGNSFGFKVGKILTEIADNETINGKGSGNDGNLVCMEPEHSESVNINDTLVLDKVAKGNCLTVCFRLISGYEYIKRGNPLLYMNGPCVMLAGYVY